jgi:hypothetical protein
VPFISASIVMVFAVMPTVRNKKRCCFVTKTYCLIFILNIGDGDPNVSSTALTMNGGTDNPDFKSQECFAIGFDLGGGADGKPDGNMDFLMGYPSEENANSQPMPCATSPTAQLGTECFGLYFFESGVSPRDQIQVSSSSSSGGV